MPAHKHYWLLDTAKAFGMDIDQLVAYLGYSRGTIYSASNNHTTLASGRLADAKFKMELLNEKLLKSERKKAEENYKKREKMIEYLFDRIG